MIYQRKHVIILITFLVFFSYVKASPSVFAYFFPPLSQSTSIQFPHFGVPRGGYSFELPGFFRVRRPNFFPIGIPLDFNCNIPGCLGFNMPAGFRGTNGFGIGALNNFPLGSAIDFTVGGVKGYSLNLLPG